MKFASLILTAAMVATSALSAPLDERAAFGTSPGRDVDAAIKRAQKDKKRVILFAYNEKGDSPGDNWPGLDIKHFMELQETKVLLRDNFIIVCLHFGHRDLDRYKPAGNTEKAYWVLIGPNGQTIKAASVYGNPSVGLKTVKELIALP